MDLPESHCPHCGHFLDSADSFDDPSSRPAPGDLTLCLYCGALLEFSANLKLQDGDEACLSQKAKRVVARIRLALKKAGPLPSARVSSN